MMRYVKFFFFFFFNDTATTEIYTLSLHDALPIFEHPVVVGEHVRCDRSGEGVLGVGVDVHLHHAVVDGRADLLCRRARPDRKSTRLNSSHANISYAVFCLKKKKIITKNIMITHLS